MRGLYDRIAGACGKVSRAAANRRPSLTATEFALPGIEIVQVSGRVRVRVVDGIVIVIVIVVIVELFRRGSFDDAAGRGAPRHAPRA